MTNYIELKNALIAFRLVFKQKILTSNDLSKEDIVFFRKVINTDVLNWTAADAFKLYTLLSKFRNHLKLVKFNFDVVQKVQINVRTTQNSNDKIIGYDNNVFKIRAPYDKELVADIQKIPGRFYDKDTKIWTIPLNKSASVRKLSIKYKFKVGEKTIDEDIYEIIDARRQIELQTTGGSEKIKTTFMSELTNRLKNKKK